MNDGNEDGGGNGGEEVARPPVPQEGSLKTVVYMALVAFLSFMLLTIAAWFVAVVPMAVAALWAVSPLTPVVIGRVVVLGCCCLLAPLILVVPPLFRTPAARRLSTRILCCLLLAFLSLYVGLVAGLGFFMPLASLLARADILLLLLFSAGIMARGSFQLWKWAGQHYGQGEVDEEEEGEASTGATTSSSYCLAGHLGLVAGNALINGLEEGLNDLSGDVTYRFEGLRLLILLLWTVTLFVQHYTRVHANWMTFHRGRKRVNDLFKEASLTKAELTRKRVYESREERSLVNALLSRPLPLRNCCCC